jgi:hypothetical protein
LGRGSSKLASKIAAPCLESRVAGPQIGVLMADDQLKEEHTVAETAETKEAAPDEFDLDLRHGPAGPSGTEGTAMLCDTVACGTGPPCGTPNADPPPPKTSTCALPCVGGTP